MVRRGLTPVCPNNGSEGILPHGDIGRIAGFDLEVAEQRKAPEDKSQDKYDRKKMEARLELCRMKKPYRDGE